MSNMLDKPLEPGKINRVAFVVLSSQVEVSHADVLRLLVEKACAELFGPRCERVRVPIDAGGIRLTISAQLEKWGPVKMDVEK